MLRLLLLLVAALTFLLSIKQFSLGPASIKTSSDHKLLSPWEIIPSSKLALLSNSHPETSLSPQIQRYWRALFVGDFQKLPPKLHGNIKILQLQHLFTPSGMHFWPVQYFLLFFEFLILSLLHIPFPYLFHSEKRSRIAQFLFMIPRIIFYLFPQFIQGLHALKRMGLFYLTRIFTSKKYSSFCIFFILSTIDVIIGLLLQKPFFLISTVASSPLSFFYTFIFLGSLLCSPGNFLSSLYFIFFAHIFLACVWEMPITTLSLIATPLLAGQITFLFALLLLQWVFLPCQFIHQWWLKLCVAITEAQIKQIHFLGNFYSQKSFKQFEAFKWIEPSWPLLLALALVPTLFVGPKLSNKWFRIAFLVYFFLHAPDLTNQDRKIWRQVKNQAMMDYFQTSGPISHYRQSRLWEKKLKAKQRPKQELIFNNCLAIPLTGEWKTECKHPKHSKKVRRKKKKVKAATT